MDGMISRWRDRCAVRRVADLRAPDTMAAMSDTAEHVRRSIEASGAVIESLAGQAERIAAIADAIVDALARGAKVLTAGHGGSAADALHMAEELVGRFDGDRRSLPAVALVADGTAMSCIANDFGYARVFARQIESLGNAGDVLALFSTSGNSAGLAEAIETARARRMTTVALLGKGGGAVAGTVDHELIVASDITARIQEAHTLVLHLVLEAIERRFAD
jgi:D-sedoheptulose 7-phosphate isomerase